MRVATKDISEEVTPAKKTTTKNPSLTRNSQRNISKIFYDFDSSKDKMLEADRNL